MFEPLATPDPMERAQILASYAGTVVQLLEAGILTREQAVKEMREMGNGLGMLQGLDEHDV